MGRMCSGRVQRPSPHAFRGDVARRYERHRPEETVLYDVVDRHKRAFFAQLEEEGRRVPSFVRDEFEAYLRTERPPRCTGHGEGPCPCARRR
ncbi:MAG: hypothetical protein ACI8W7_001769 [Gammaproteobacteria bacterium]|jgi:hypothetical protein